MTYSVNAVETIHTKKSNSLSMAEAMTILPDAIFCHKFWAVLGDKEIKCYLFDRQFEVTGLKKCTMAMPNCDNQKDCCIGNNQQILDALSPHKSHEDCMRDMFDIMGAFFTVPSKKMRGHISPDIIFLPLEQMMRELLYKSLDEYCRRSIILRTVQGYSWHARQRPDAIRVIRPDHWVRSEVLSPTPHWDMRWQSHHIITTSLPRCRIAFLHRGLVLDRPNTSELMVIFMDLFS